MDRRRTRLVIVGIVGLVVVAGGIGYAATRLGRQPTLSSLPLQPTIASPVPTLVVRVSAKGVRQCGLGFAEERLWTLRETGTSSERYGPVLAVADNVDMTDTSFCGFSVHFVVRPDEPPAFMVVEDDPSDSSLSPIVWGSFGTDKALSDGMVPVNLKLS
jgi:hypothetical protein